MSMIYVMRNTAGMPGLAVELIPSPQYPIGTNHHPGQLHLLGQLPLHQPATTQPQTHFNPYATLNLGQRTLQAHQIAHQRLVPNLQATATSSTATSSTDMSPAAMSYPTPSEAAVNIPLMSRAAVARTTAQATVPATAQTTAYLHAAQTTTTPSRAAAHSNGSLSSAPSSSITNGGTPYCTRLS
jgi:hypothetical protein